MPSAYWIRQAQHTLATNPNASKGRKPKRQSTQGSGVLEITNDAVDSVALNTVNLALVKGAGEVALPGSS